MTIDGVCRMYEKVNPQIFAQIMGLSSQIRRDLLEFMGQTPICEVELQRLLAAALAESDTGISKAS